MAEYIEREAALNADFKIPAKRLDTRIKTARDAVQAYANYIAALPAADVKPVVRGRWIEGEYEWTCSVCGEKFSFYDNAFLHDGYFCPNCGADMRNEVEE